MIYNYAQKLRYPILLVKTSARKTYIFWTPNTRLRKQKIKKKTTKIPIGLSVVIYVFTSPLHSECNMWSVFSLMSRVFANGLRDQFSMPGWVIPKIQKMVLDATLLDTHNYQIRIKGKVKQFREWSSNFLYTSV